MLLAISFSASSSEVEIVKIFGCSLHAIYRPASVLILTMEYISRRKFRRLYLAAKLLLERASLSRGQFSSFGCPPSTQACFRAHSYPERPAPMILTTSCKRGYSTDSRRLHNWATL